MEEAGFMTSASHQAAMEMLCLHFFGGGGGYVIYLYIESTVYPYLLYKCLEIMYSVIELYVE